MAKARQKTDRLLLPRMGRSRLNPKQDRKNGAQPSSFAYFIISLPGAGPRAARSKMHRKNRPYIREAPQPIAASAPRVCGTTIPLPSR